MNAVVTFSLTNPTSDLPFMITPETGEILTKRLFDPDKSNYDFQVTASNSEAPGDKHSDTNVKVRI